MIDLYMHTINSDGSYAPEQLLRKCGQLNLGYISINDHDACKSYDDLKKLDINKFFTGKIIPGCELTTSFEGRTLEILGYSVDTDYINKWLNNFYTNEKK